MRRLRIYSPRELLTDDCSPVPLLWPFWNINDNADPSPDRGRFDLWQEAAPSLIELTSLAQCDLVVAPMQWKAGESNVTIRTLAQQSVAAGKKMAIFFVSDSSEPIEVPGCIVWRTSFFASTRRSYERAIPAWSQDLLDARNGQVQLRPYCQKPTVGFCGQSSVGIRRERLWQNVGQTVPLRGLAWHGAHTLNDPSRVWRHLLLRALERAPTIETNFIERNRFWGHAISDEATYPQLARDEFIANLQASDYALCVRGTGNFSYRLYEALSCGRIPIFVNTDSVLPWEDTLNWRELCVWVEAREWQNIGELVRAFHRQLDAESFAMLQLRCRHIWEEWLSPYGFWTQWCQIHGDKDAAMPSN